jgi:hypothetical protein
MFLLLMGVSFPVDFACLKRDFFSYLLVSSSFYVWKRITTLDQKNEFREMLVLVKRFFKFHFDADILRTEVEEKLLE